MLNAAITCAKSPYPGGLGCGQLFIDTLDSSDLSADLPEAIAKVLAEHGWAEVGGEHYCPVHNPAEAGDVVEIAPVRYRPLGASGWEARIPGNGHAQGMGVNIEIRPRTDNENTDGPADELEPVSATDWAAESVKAFLAAWAVDGHSVTRDCEVAVTRAGDELYALTEPDLGALLAERAALRALAPGERDGEDPFYRPGGVYVSANGWWRFTCRAVVAGVALGVEECLKDRIEPRFTKRNIWRSVRAAGCDYEVDPETGDPLNPRDGEE